MVNFVLMELPKACKNSFLCSVALHTPKTVSKMYDRVFVKAEKALNSWIKDRSRKKLFVDSNA